MAKRLFDMAFGSGVNIVDLYSLGLAEEVAGQALGSKRNDILLATKGRSPMNEDPTNEGASRYHLIRPAKPA